jgi:hypothetical protein
MVGEFRRRSAESQHQKDACAFRRAMGQSMPPPPIDSQRTERRNTVPAPIQPNTLMTFEIILALPGPFNPPTLEQPYLGDQKRRLPQRVHEALGFTQTRP